MEKIEKKLLTDITSCSALTITGGIIGGIFGYELGCEMVNYAQNIPESKDVLTHIISEYPNLTKLIMAYGFYDLGAKPGLTYSKIKGLVSKI